MSEVDRLATRSFMLRGGFGVSTSSTGNIHLTQAVVAIIAHVAVVPFVIKRFGALKTYRWTLFIFPWMYYLTHSLAEPPIPFATIALLLDLWIKVLLVALGYVCSALLLIAPFEHSRNLKPDLGALWQSSTDLLIA